MFPGGPGKPGMQGAKKFGVSCIITATLAPRLRRGSLNGFYYTLNPKRKLRLRLAFANDLGIRTAKLAPRLRRGLAKRILLYHRPRVCASPYLQSHAGAVYGL